MLPDEHIDWFDENVHWFENLPLSSLDNDVPSCPGWTVERVVNHLTFGLGMAYPYALATDADATDEPWSEVPWPRRAPAGREAIRAFAEHMEACVELFRNTDPAKPCWTYAGPGRAGFWFRRAAIETALHRMDVAEALGLSTVIVKPERVLDAVEDAIGFALPLAAEMTGGPPESSVVVRVSGHETELTLGHGPPGAELAGDGAAVLSALWGRSKDKVEVTGDRAVADHWMSLVESAFADR